MENIGEPQRLQRATYISRALHRKLCTVNPIQGKRFKTMFIILYIILVAINYEALKYIQNFNILTTVLCLILCLVQSYYVQTLLIGYSDYPFVVEVVDYDENTNIQKLRLFFTRYYIEFKANVQVAKQEDNRLTLLIPTIIDKHSIKSSNGAKVIIGDRPILQFEDADDILYSILAVK